MRWLKALLAVLLAVLVGTLSLEAISDDDATTDGPAEPTTTAKPLAALIPIPAHGGAGAAPPSAKIEGQLQAAPGAISVMPDPLGGDAPTFEFTVDEGDVFPLTPTDDPRAQALSAPVIEAGDEIWLKTRFMLPADFPSVPGWMSLVSIYGPPFEGSSPWQIGIDANEIRWQRNDTYGYDVPWRMPLATGRWITILLHQRFAADGWVEMWVAGHRATFFPPGSYNPGHHPQVERLEMATVDESNDEGANSAKIMQYRQAGMFDSSTVYFGALRVGTTRAAVAG